MDIDIRNCKPTKLTDIATIERANPNTVYPAGCTLIPLSAADYKLIRYLDTDGHVENKFAVVNPHRGIHRRYVYTSILVAAPEFFHTYQTGINLQINILQKCFTILFHDDPITQKYIADLVETVEERIDYEQQIINQAVLMKKNMLARLMI